MKKAIVPRRSYRSGYRRSRSRSRSPHSKNYNSRRSGDRSGRSGGGGGRNDRSGGSRGGGGQDRKRKSSGESSSSNSKKKKKPYNDKKGTFTPASLLDAVENGFFSKSTELLVSDSGLDISRILDLDALPLGGRISKCFENWERIVSNEWVLSVVREGYKIPLKSKPFQKAVPKNPKPKGLAAFDVLVKEAIDLKLKGAVTVVEHCQEEYVSSYFAVPKPHRENQFRPILNLKYFNDFVKKYSFNMESLKSVKDWIRPGYFCASLDIKDAFLHISIHKSSRKYLRFNWLGELLEWCSLVFGLTSSPRVITKVLKPVISFIRTHFGILISIYIDDILIQSISFEKCIRDTQVVILVLLCLGWSVKWEKCSLIPSQKFVHLGFLFDTEAMSLTCPVDKVERIKKMCYEILVSGSSTVLGLEKLLGTLESVRPAVPLAVLHFRCLQKQLLLSKKSDRIASKVIFISKESSQELSWWIEELLLNCTAPIREPEPTVQIYSDANLLMGGSHCTRGRFHQRAWSQEELSQDLHINLLEIRAAREALVLAEPGDLVRLHIDSRTAASYIRRQGGTKSSLLSAEACQLWREAVSRHLTILTPHWLSTKENIMADFLSRHEMGQWECVLSHPTLNMVLETFQLSPTLDVFASRETYRLERYMSWYPDPRAVARDAMMHKWDPVSYLFPPVPMLLKTLQKIKAESIRAVMILPMWPTSLWWNLMIEMLVEPPLTLPCYRTIVSMTDPTRTLPYLAPLVAVHLKAQS